MVRARRGWYAIAVVGLAAVIWLGVSGRRPEAPSATRAPPVAPPAPPAPAPPLRRASPAAAPTGVARPSAAAPSPAPLPRPRVDWDATPVLDGQDEDLPPALRQGIGDAASAFFHGAGRPHRHQPDCWKRYPPPANAPEPIRLDLGLRMKREAGRLVIAGVGLDHANSDLGKLGDCLAQGYAAFQPVPVDAPGVAAGAPFRTELHIQQYGRSPEDNEGAARPVPSAPLVAMDLGGLGKTPDCPSTMRTSGAAGAPCKTPMDCTEVCCGCPASSRWFATSVCDQGRCVGGAAACTVALARPARQLCAAPDPPAGGR